MIYLPYILSIIGFLSALYAIARVRTLSIDIKKVGFEDFADVHSDVQALKNQLKKQLLKNQLKQQLLKKNKYLKKLNSIFYKKQ